jgi:hypothetical protein
MMYRIYWIGADGRIKGAENIDCATDQDAVAEAWQRIGHSPGMEVWQEARRVAGRSKARPTR